MKLPLSILAGTVLATALFSSLTGCSEEPPTGTGTGGTGAAPSAGGSSGQGGSAGTGGSSGQGAAGTSAAGTSAAGTSAAAGRSSGGAAGTCSIMTRADPIAGASGGGGMSGGAGRGAGGRSSGGASSGGASSGGMSSGGASSGGMSSGGMSSGGMSSGGMSSGGMSSGGSAGTSTDAYPPTWDNFKFVLTATSPACTASDCHGLNGPNVLQFTVKDDAILWKNISERVSTQCGNLKVVEPGHPEQSALVKILKGPCAGPCGITPRMPKDCADTDNCLPDDVISAIEKWIAMGAIHP